MDDDRDTADTLVLTRASLGLLRCPRVCTEPRAVRELHMENNYDLIVLDMQMPHMDRFEVMESLKEFERDGYLPVLAITGEPGHRVPALKLGAKDFLRKPIDIEELLVRVRNMLEVRLLYKELEAATLGAGSV